MHDITRLTLKHAARQTLEGTARSLSIKPFRLSSHDGHQTKLKLNARPPLTHYRVSWYPFPLHHETVPAYLGLQYCEYYAELERQCSCANLLQNAKKKLDRLLIKTKMKAKAKNEEYRDKNGIIFNIYLHILQTITQCCLKQGTTCCLIIALSV